MRSQPEPIRLLPRAARLAAKGRTWFFADDLEPKSALPEAALVRVQGSGGADLGIGCTSTRSKIALRLCGPWPGEAVPEPREFLAARLRQAIARRRALEPEAGVRLVHGDADALPGLVVDRYGPCAVVQITAAWLEVLLDTLVPELVSSTGVDTVIARNDLAARDLEGLPREVRLLHGRRLDSVSIREGGVTYTVRPFTGHKTGFYLDQRPARAFVRGRAAGRRVLDLFSYQAAFSLAALAGGAVESLAVDQSEAALELARADAGRNGLHGLAIECGNAFTVLRALREEGRTFDLIVLDPPAFARSRRERTGGLRGYRDLNRQALRLLAPAGLLVTCTCSHHVDLPMFEGVLRQAAAGLPFLTLLRERLGAGADHPVRLGLPESEYLKVVALERADYDTP